MNLRNRFRSRHSPFGSPASSTFDAARSAASVGGSLHQCYSLRIRKCPHFPHVSGKDTNHGSNVTIAAAEHQTKSRKRLLSDQRDGFGRSNLLNSPLVTN